jgi:ribosomal protein S18 acetylase RimI-like enzyme
MGIIIRELLKQDRDAVREMLVACGTFTTEEVQVALELLDEGTSRGVEGDYCLFAADVDGEVRGYVCIGKTPLTRSTWHLYWICVQPRAQHSGIGQCLQLHAEEFIRSRGGDLLVLETSTQPSYGPTHRFYQKAGYREAGRIPDFYKPQDDCVIYWKDLS